MLRRSAILLIVLIAVLFLAARFLPLPSPKPYSPVVSDRNGRLLGVFRARDGIWRIRTSPEEIPFQLKKILLTKEDRWFYYHPGVNPVAVLRAVFQNVRSGHRISGASTITMQVARMLEPKERTLTNKLLEMFRAVQLECRYSKDQILELYLSLVPLGGNIEGLATASLLYYQAPLERLNVAQLIDLILIPNDPNDLRPDRHGVRLQRLRRIRAQQWLKSGLLNAADSVVVMNAEAETKRTSLPLAAPHLTIRIKDEHRTMSEMRTTIDLHLQQNVQRLLEWHLRFWKQRGVVNGAALVVDHRSMEVRAYVGSPSFTDSIGGGQIDAVRALRSPGSTLKPFLFALAMDRGTLTPKTRLLDVPFDVEGYHTENYDGSFCGWIPADEALQRSLNVPMVRLLHEAGLTRFSKLLQLAGIKSLAAQEGSIGLSMIAGGCGLTLEELVQAYSIFPEGGVFRPLRYDTLTGHEAPVRVISPGAAFMVTEILEAGEGSDEPSPRFVYKTGTSYGRRDAWCVGYSSAYTIGVWIGNVNNEGSPDLSGGQAAAPLLSDLFRAVGGGHSGRIVEIPQDVDTRDVCAESGKLPMPHCKRIIEDYYSITHTLNEVCDLEKEIAVSADRKTQYCPSCQPPTNYRMIVVKDYPAELPAFWKRMGKQVPQVPRHNSQCQRTFSGTGPRILSPTQAARYLLSEGQQVIPFQATSNVDVREHNWYVNGQYLGRKKAGEQFFQKLSNGEYTISCADDKGRISTVKIQVQTL